MSTVKPLTQDEDDTQLDLILTFPSSHFALKAEQELERLDLSVKSKLISAPRSISSQCGFCLLITSCQVQPLIQAIVQAEIQYQYIYIRQIIDGVKTYVRKD